MATSKETTIEKKYFKDGCNRTATYQEIFKVKINGTEYKVKVYINSDKQYKNSISVFSLSELEWKHIYSIPNSLMHTQEEHCYGNNPNINTSNFSKDISTLKEKFYEIMK